MQPVHNSFGLTIEARSPEVMQVAHRHSEIELNLVETGGLTYSFGGSHISIGAGARAAFWGAMPHQLIDVAPQTRFTCITLPLAWFLRWNLPAAFTRRMMEGQPIISAESSPLDTLLFRRWAEDMGAAPDRFQTIILLELEAWFRRAALTAYPRTVFSASVADAAEKMAQYIAANYAEPITVADIARATSLHPNYAMQVFRRAYHTTMLDYLTQHRVAHAQRLLVLTDASVASIALDVGFGSQSRFYEAFTRICGQPPGAFRSAYR